MDDNSKDDISQSNTPCKHISEADLLEHSARFRDIKPYDDSEVMQAEEVTPDQGSRSVIYNEHRNIDEAITILDETAISQQKVSPPPSTPAAHEKD